MELSSGSSGWYSAWAVAKEAVGNTVSEALFLNTIADTPHATLDADLSAGERAWAGAKGIGAAALNLGGGGVVAKAAVGRLAATRPVQWGLRRLAQARVTRRGAELLAQDVGVVWNRLTRKADEASELVYRRIRADETGVLRRGLTARNPTAAASPEEHVLGATKGHSQYISTSRDYEAAVRIYGRGGQPVVEIDLFKVKRYVDLSDARVRTLYLQDRRALYNATRDVEVLIEGSVPPGAIRKIIFPTGR
jgi:hypothetical protein